MAELTDEDIQFIQELREAHEERRISRREALGTLGAAGVGAAVGFIGSGTAAADPSTSDSDGNVGTPDNPADVFAEGLAGPNGAAVDVGDSLIPDTDASYDLGAAGATWNNLFAALVNTGAIGNGGSPLSVNDNLDLQSSQSISNAATVSASRVDNDDYHETVVSESVSGTAGLDLSAANVFEHTLTGDTNFEFNNPSSSPAGNSFTIVVQQDGTGGHSLSWPSSVQWDSGSVPSLDTSANAKHMLGFVSPDGGSTWIGVLSASEIA
jgi:hypothetical protein